MNDLVSPADNMALLPDCMKSAQKKLASLKKSTGKVWLAASVIKNKLNTTKIQKSNTSLKLNPLGVEF